MNTRILSIICGALFIWIGTYQLGFPDGFQLKKEGETLVFLGDSITEMGKQPEGYVSLFQLFCDANGYKVSIINAGIGGHKSNDMLARLDKDVLSHKPTWVSISCGVNDVWHSFMETPKGVDLPDYQNNMTEIVDRCLKSGAKVVLLTATPIMEKIDNPENQKLNPYNEFLRKLAKEKKIILCDLNQTFLSLYKKKETDKNILTTDGVHMNPQGNRVMTTEILKSLGAAERELAEAEKRWEQIAKK